MYLKLLSKQDSAALPTFRRSTKPTLALTQAVIFLPCKGVFLYAFDFLSFVLEFESFVKFELRFQV